jgi:catechol 2,3-dioxygenase-like lactoylglutathione lyase family enzyme
MAVHVLELHHHGIRVGGTPAELDQSLDFYTRVLGLTPDPGRNIPGQPGYWMDLGTAQIHLMGIAGTSSLAKSPREDPSLPHVALAVSDIQEVKKELDRLGQKYFSIIGVTGPYAEQVFLHDPAGNLIELHQIGTCRCNKTAKAGAAARMS